MKSLAAEITALKAQGLYRSHRILSTPNSAEVVVDGRRVINFCANDYLGLANHPAVVSALQRGAQTYGAGAGAAHLVCGHSQAHHALEEELAAFVARPRALLFSTGYMANLGVVTALVGRGDSVVADKWNHASLIDAAQLAGATLKRYPHADAAGAQRQLTHAAGEKILVTDGVFSMDGDLAPVPMLATLAKAHAAWLMVDDAHGVGVIGPGGRGTLAHYGLTLDDVPILVGTLGKAFGTSGAFVAGSAELIDYLIQRARSYIYTTALPPATAVATSAALRVAAEEPWRRTQVLEHVTRWRTHAVNSGWASRLLPSLTPIQPLLVGDSARAVAVSTRLFERGFWVSAIRPPTVPPGTARLRITLSAAHTAEHIDALCAALSEVLVDEA